MMKVNHLKKLETLGQSIWLRSHNPEREGSGDRASRHLRGTLRRNDPARVQGPNGQHHEPTG